jgi:hypothetical protein
MRTVLIVVAILFAAAKAAGENPLQLEIHPLWFEEEVAGKDGKPERHFRLELHSFLKNVGTRDVVIPTNTYSGGASGSVTGGNRLVLLFLIDDDDLGGREVIASPFRFFPVTLKSNEMTELPLVRWDQGETKPEKIKVVFSVGEQISRRNGWWSGSLNLTVSADDPDSPYLVSVKDKKMPNQSLEPTAMSVTPPATQEPRQP